MVKYNAVVNQMDKIDPGCKDSNDELNFTTVKEKAEDNKFIQAIGVRFKGILNWFKKDEKILIDDDF